MILLTNNFYGKKIVCFCWHLFVSIYNVV